MFEFICLLAEYITGQVRSVVERDDTGLEKFLSDEFRRWGFVVIHHPSGAAFLSPDKFHTYNSKVEVL